MQKRIVEAKNSPTRSFIEELSAERLKNQGNSINFSLGQVKLRDRGAQEYKVEQAFSLSSNIPAIYIESYAGKLRLPIHSLIKFLGIS